MAKRPINAETVYIELQLSISCLTGNLAVFSPFKRDWYPIRKFFIFLLLLLAMERVSYFTLKSTLDESEEIDLGWINYLLHLRLSFRLCLSKSIRPTNPGNCNGIRGGFFSPMTGRFINHDVDLNPTSG
ncbi:hypothetical protein [Mesobacillus foraminis]|uniref:hypothetical protein n=1 Tax=Mesobacillus foraminis TaxID=279826 RepID=UPI000EF50C33|nr:hypothetical protein [Mesobacillus foraminis]